MAAVQELPNDIEALKRLIIDEREERQAAIDEAVKVAVDEAVKAAVAAILRRYYGPRSEKFDPRQLLLFGQHVEEAPLDTASVEEESGEKLVTRRVKNRHRHGRQQLPASLERIEVEHDLADKSCPACGCERSRIGEEVSEQLEYFPASFKVLRHVRPKYGCAKCDHEGYDPNIQTAKKPPQPI
jgi:transposase